MNKRTQFPVYYDDVKGWIVLSDETLSPAILRGIQNYVYKVNSDRAKGMQGDKKKRVIEALFRLKRDGLSILSTKREMTLFQSTEKETTKSYHFIGGK